MTSRRIGLLGRLARTVSCCVLGYWGLFALLAPVVNVDSQMYNLARVQLADAGGLWDNGAFTSVYHVVMPWGFDALHLAFMKLGWGYALPSFLCLAGVCFVTFRMVRARRGEDAGWLTVLGLLGLTCLVYQGTSTKNDIPIVFAGAVWFYARWHWRRGGGVARLFWMIVAVGFMAGAKTTGLLFAVPLGVWTVWEVFRRGGGWARALVGLTLAVLLFGSIETYVETWRIYRNPLGPESVLGQMRNRDGVQGGVANVIRYLGRGVYVGFTSGREGPSMAGHVSATTRAFLAKTGLENKGASPQFLDEHLFMFQSGHEELCGYGLSGMWALGVCGIAWFWVRPRRTWWRLAVGAWCVLAMVALSVAYTDWANRYLLCAYVLAVCAAVSLLWESERRVVRAARWIFLASATYSALAAPVFSFNRGPDALMAAMMAREELETSSFPLAGAVRSRLRELKKQIPSARVYYVVCNDSVILPLLRDRDVDPVLVTPPVFTVIMAEGLIRAGDLVVEDYPLRSDRMIELEKVQVPDLFSPGSARVQTIYTVGPEPSER